MKPGSIIACRALRVALLLVAPALAAGACSKKAESKQPRIPAVPVAVAVVEQKPMPVQIQAIGSVEANAVVSVRAQVGGELVRIHFKEGQDVRKGEMLFTIDRRPFQAALAQIQATQAQHQAQVTQAEANLSRDQAQLENAKVEEERYRRLVAGGFVAREQYDQFHTTLKTAEATIQADLAAVATAKALVRADDAAVETARLNLAYTEIKAPIDGRTGSLMLHEGNVVRSGGTSDSTLLVINQIQPIFVSFTVPQQQLSAVKTYMQAGSLSVEALPAGDKRPERGVVTFVDNAIDPTTGTVRLKATFPNTEKRLWPGQFANVTLTLTVDPNALVVPSQAVQTGQQGASYVFVVKPDLTVENRRVVVARTQGSDSVITSGLQAGEQVVTDGQPRLSPGTKVEVRGAPASGRPGGPGGRPADGKSAAPEGKAAPAEGKSAAPDAKPGAPEGKPAAPAAPTGKPKV